MSVSLNMGTFFCVLTTHGSNFMFDAPLDSKDIHDR